MIWRGSSSARKRSCNQQPLSRRGPSLDDLTAAAQKAGESVPDYVRESIEDPNAVVTEGYQPGVMPQNFKDSLSSEEIDALVAYVGGEEESK